MSEQKVWVEKMPENCDECPCSLRGKDDCAYCNLLHKNIGYDFGKRPKHCPLHSIKDHDRELVRRACEKIIKFINELAWRDIQFDAFQSTIGEFSGSTGSIPRYAKKYFKLWKEMFGEDLNQME